MNIPARYTRTAIAFHWLIALLVAVNIGLVLSFGSVPDAYIRPLIDTHKSIGITVLGLALLRAIWRATHRPPPLPASYARWERRVSHAAHIALYVLIFAMPLSGWLHDSAWKDAATHPMRLFGLVPWPRIGFITDLDPATKEMLHRSFGEIHGALATTLCGIVALHIAGALKHQFFDRQPELQRMLPGSWSASQ